MVLLLQCNVKPPLAREIRRLSGIALTSDLGRDLGVPLLHQKGFPKLHIRLISKVVGGSSYFVT